MSCLRTGIRGGDVKVKMQFMDMTKSRRLDVRESGRLRDPSAYLEDQKQTS